jgi:hypothetical protein
LSHDLPAASAIVIAGAQHAAALRKRMGSDPSVVVYSDTEALTALDAITARPPKIVALDPAFVTTARGALLVSRLKDVPDVDVRVLTEDQGKLPVLLANPQIALLAASEPIDRCGTRATPRFHMKKHVEVKIDGERSQLVNLSITGAQVVMPARLQPQQNVRLTLVDGTIETRFRALVAWSALELGHTVVRYRAGITFVDPDTHIIEAFCLRHGASA